MKPGLSVSIVNYNTWDATFACYQAILASCSGWTDFEILIHNNGRSIPANIVFELATVSNSGQNLGFGAGQNRNIEAAKFDVLLILNPDVIVNREALEELVHTVRARNVAAAAPLLRNGDGSVQFSNRRLPTMMTEFARIVGRDRKPGSPASTLLSLKAHSGTIAVQQPAGAAIAMMTDVALSIGGFDSNFRMYFEDVDLCRRLAGVGPIVVLTNVSFVHEGEGTAKNYRRATTFWIENSRLRYHKKYEPEPRRTMFKIICGTSSFTHAAAHALKAASQCDANLRKASQERAFGYMAAFISAWMKSDKYWESRFLKN